MPIQIPPPSPSDYARYLGIEVAQVERVIGRVRYLRLRDELLESSNPAIDIDKQALVSRLETLGFRADIASALQELDRRIYEAGKALDFKSCMDLARTIFEEIVEDAGRRVAAIRKQDAPTIGAKGNFTPWKKALVDCGALTGGEGVMFQSFYDYLSSAGTHRLGSEPEQAHVARNVVIEFGLLVVGRVQMFQ